MVTVTHMTLVIFLSDLCGYVWVNIRILSHLRFQMAETEGNAIYLSLLKHLESISRSDEWLHVIKNIRDLTYK